MHYTEGPIVYVDDDEDDHFLLNRALTELGFSNKVISFRDGQPALDYLMLTREQPLIILSDINMPFLNGLELRGKIDADEYLKQKAIPFIFFTTGSVRTQIEQAYKGNIQGFHTKAENFTLLKQQIDLIITYWKACLHPKSFK